MHGRRGNGSSRRPSRCSHDPAHGSSHCRLWRPPPGCPRPTLYRWFPSKEALLEVFGRYEQRKYDDGIADAVRGLDGDARLDTVLRFIVEFQHSYSLRRLVDVEPEYVVREMTRVLPIMRDRLLPHFPGPGLHRRLGRDTARVEPRPDPRRRSRAVLRRASPRRGLDLRTGTRARRHVRKPARSATRERIR